MPTNGVYVDDTENVAREFLMIAPARYLLSWTLAAGLAVVIAAGADIGAVYYVMRQRSLDAFGNFSGSQLELLAVSCATLIAYWGIGILWEKGRRWAVVAVYSLIVGFLFLAIYPTEAPRFRELWDSYAGSHVFGWRPANGNTAKDAPLWFLMICNALFAIAFTVAGLLFVWAKMWLVYWLNLWHARGTAQQVLVMAEQAQAEHESAKRHAVLYAYYDDPAHRNQAIKNALRVGVDAYANVLKHKRDTLISTLIDVEAAKAAKRQAESELIAAEKCIGSLRRYDGLRHYDGDPSDRTPPGSQANRQYVPPYLRPSVPLIEACIMLFMLLITAQVCAEGVPRPTQETLATAPTFQILLDNSRSSPARDVAFIASVLPMIDQKLRAMPVGTSVIVTTVGDASLMPLRWHTRIQVRKTNSGAPVEDIIRDLHQFLLEFPKQMEGREHPASHLIGGLFDAARNLNPQAQSNEIVMISDLIEYSPLANCERARPACRLPAPQFKLEGANVSVYGAGMRLPSDRAMTLTQAWEAFFQKTGVRKAELRR